MSLFAVAYAVCILLFVTGVVVTAGLAWELWRTWR